MPSLRLAILAMFLIGPTIAHAADGAVYVYLQPLPSYADRITFTIERVSATTDAGAETSLNPSIKSITGRESRRQRLLASGRVAAGSYTGLTIRIGKASLKGEAGEVSLLVPATPIKLDSPFLVTGGRAVVLWLTLDATGPPAGSASFTPTFEAKVADRPLTGRAGFVSSSGSNSITMFDKRLHQAALVILTGEGPSGMALDQRLGRLYAACARDDEILTVDVTAAEVVERARLAPGDGPREIALTPDGRTLLSANAGSNTVGIFDAVPLTRLDRLRVGSGPNALAIDPTGRRAFVFNTLSNSISVIDIQSRSVVATISTEWAPLRGGFSTRGDRLYVIHERSPYMTVVDPLQLSVVARPRLHIGIESVRVDTTRGLLYIGGRGDAMVEFYDPTTLLPVGAMKTRAGVWFLAIDAEENSLYMVSPDTRSVLVGNLADRRMVAEIDVGEDPYWVSVMGER